MTRYTYPAIITYYPEDGGTYVVRFPDFPELEVADDNIVDALDGMNSMLEVLIEDIVDRPWKIPEPTPFEQHLHQDENCVSWWTIAHCDVDDERYAKIADGNYVYEAESAFHANRPSASDEMAWNIAKMTSGLMNPVGAEPVDHDAYEECLADSKGDDQ